MNDECTKGKDKRDDNYSRGVHGALRVLVTPAPCFALTSSDQIGRLLMMHTRKRVNFVSLNFTDYVSMALCMGDNRVGDTSDLLDLPQEMGLARRGSF